MCEFLVYNKAHWMDKYTLQEFLTLHGDTPKNIRKYESRYQRGDIVEVREDGYWIKRGFNKEAFVVVKVPGLPVDNKYTATIEEADIKGYPLLTRKRAWNIKVLDVPEETKSEMETTGETSMLWKNVESFVKEKYLDGSEVKER